MNSVQKTTWFFEFTAENKTVVSQWSGKLLSYNRSPRCKMFSYLLLSVCLVIAFCPTVYKGRNRLTVWRERDSKTYKIKRIMAF